MLVVEFAINEQLKQPSGHLHSTFMTDNILNILYEVFVLWDQLYIRSNNLCVRQTEQLDYMLWVNFLHMDKRAKP